MRYRESLYYITIINWQMFNGPEICAGDEKTNRNTERENRHEQKHLLQALLAAATVYLTFF